jgi:hypothetical protein
LFFGLFDTFFLLLLRFVGSVEGPVWFKLSCLVGLGIKSLLRKRRRLSDTDPVNSCKIIGSLDLAYEHCGKEAALSR